MLARVSLTLALIGLGAACTSAPPYECTSNAQCIDTAGASGICEADSFCSFGDTTCTGTTRRYSEGAGDGKAGVCVAPPTESCIDDLTGGEAHFCLVRHDGTVWCWGANDAGQLGDNTKTDRARPTKVMTPSGKTFVQVVASENHTCALAADHTVWCWGANDVGQLGIVSAAGTPLSESLVPIQIQAVAGVAPNLTFSPFISSHLAAGGKHVCAVNSSGGVACWGENADGQCGKLPPSHGGAPDADDLLYPTQVPGLTEGIIEVAVGDEHSTALKDNGSVFAFGGNANGQLGDGTTTDSSSPVQSKITSVTGVSGGDEHTCAAKSDGTIWCWGYGASAGIDGGTDQPMPQRTVTARSTFAGGSAFHTCATQETSFLCWGQNDRGQVGAGSIDPDNATVASPVRALLATVARAAPSTTGTCAVTVEGQLWCWGANDHGQQGTGSTGPDTSTPERVTFSCK